VKEKQATQTSTDTISVNIWHNLTLCTYGTWVEPYFKR